MKRLLLALSLALFVAAAPSDAGLFGQIEEIVRKLADITGWQLKRTVPAAMMTKAELDRYLNEKVSKEVKPEEVRAEQVTLRALGFVDETFDLKQSVLEVLNEQAAAFYDTRKKRLYVMESSAGQVGILVHELGHALADQYFSLDRFIKHAGKSDDAHMARMAVMEGQATWLMSEWQASLNGQTLIGRPEMVALMSKPAAAAGGEFPALEKAPLYLQETLLFPYTKGLSFQHAVIERRGKAGFAEVFSDPPVTTQQILHPDWYFAKRPAEAIELPPVTIAKGFKELAEGNLGELDHQILLRQFKVTDWEIIAEAWRGSIYKVWENKKTKRTLLLYASIWESEGAARRFFDAYRRRVLPVKKRGFVEESGTEDSVEARSEEGRVTLLRRGRQIFSVEGVP